MYQLGRRVATVTAATLLLAASGMLAFPASASADTGAETKTVPCGGEVTASPGDRIRATTPLLGLPLDLGIVHKGTTVLTGTINALLGTLCTVTVHVVDTVTEPLPDQLGEPVGQALKQGTKKLTDAAQDTVDSIGSAVAPGSPAPGAAGSSPRPDAPRERSSGEPESGFAENNQKSGGDEPNTPTNLLAPSSPAVGGGVPLSGAFLPDYFGSGWAPMRDYSGIPVATPGLFAPAPGIRYGSQVPGYEPEFGILGAPEERAAKQAGQRADSEPVAEIGRVRALPGSSGSSGMSPTSLPILLAVVALAASTAALVRTWVLRRV